MSQVGSPDPLDGPIIRTPQPAPLQGQTEPYFAGVGAAFTAAGAGSLGASVIARAWPGGPNNALVQPADAAKQLPREQGFDASVLPKGPVYQSTIDAIKAQQQVVNNASDAARRSSSAGSVAQFVAGVAGGLTDPLFLALGPLGRGVAAVKEVAGIAKGAGVAARVATGAAEGAAVMGGYTEAERQAGTAPGDRDITSYDVLKQTGVGMVIGSPVKGVFGPRAARENAISTVMAQEGGLTTDTGGLTKFGVSQKAHPNVDIANLNVSQARAIFKDEYWDKIGGDELPANMQLTALDSAVNQGVAKTQGWLEQAKGDPVAFNALRRADYERLATENPGKYGKYLQGWLNRLGKISLQTVQPFFPEARGETNMAVAGQAEAVSRGQLGPVSRVGSRIEIPAPETGVDYSSVQAANEDTQAALERDTLDRLGKMDLPITTAYPGSVNISVGESLRRFQDRFPNPIEQAANLPPEVKDAAAKTAVAQASQDSEVNVEPVIRAGIANDNSGLAEATPRPGSIFLDQRLGSAMLERIDQQATKAPPPSAVPGESPELTALKSQAAQSVQEAEHAHAMAFGLPKEGEETPLHTELKAADEETKDDALIAKATDAAVRCSLLKGLD